MSRRRALFATGPKGPADNEIWYTSTDGQIITPSGYTILSNTYEGGIGKIVTSGKITSIPDIAWLNKMTLSSIQYKWENILTIGSFSFGNTPNLTTEIVVPNCTSIESVAFYEGTRKIGSGITGFDAPLCTSIGTYAFEKCSALIYANIPSAISINAVFLSSGIKRVYSRDLQSVGDYTFQNCSRLEMLVIDNVTPPTIGTGSFSRTPDFQIYVPDSAVETYKAASGWSTYASRIHPMSELPE